jgi:signal transduction histidine kinase
VKEKIGPLLEQDIPESLQYILTSVAKMDSLLNGLLKLSRLGHTVLKPEKIDMDKLINNVINAFEFKIKESDVKLEISKLPPCKADKTQIDQVFSNLIDNALKYLDSKRHGIIKISGHKKNIYSVYCVEDNGIGIVSKHQENIFAIFHQLNPDRVPGQGLGLTIVRRILDRHRGKVWVESEKGKGSKFYVSLPGG